MEKKYKTLGNTIRASVFRAKEAPTMLPDETIEKLGLGEDDIMSIMEEPPLDEASKFKSSFEQRATAHKLATQLSHEINNIAIPDPDSVRYEYPSRNYKKEEAQSVKRMDKLISQLEALSKLVSKSGSKF